MGRGTLPELYEKDGMIELSMADVAGGGIVTGSALMREKPIYVIRYQGFNWYNAPMIVNYATKSKKYGTHHVLFCKRNRNGRGNWSGCRIITSLPLL